MDILIFPHAGNLDNFLNKNILRTDPIQEGKQLWRNLGTDRPLGDVPTHRTFIDYNTVSTVLFVKFKR